MLVLSRRRGESIQVGDSIVITVVELRDGKVRLAFTAPRDVPIFRTELLTEGTNNGTPIQGQENRAIERIEEED